MKIVAIIVVLILLAVAGVLIFSPKAPKDVQSLEVKESTDNQNQQQGTDAQGAVEVTEFSFVGYGPGKSHVGVFEKYEVKNVKVNESGIPVAGELVIDVNSIKTDAALLDTHLKEKAEFFDTAKYPTITFALSNTTETGAGLFQVSGNLTVKGVTKQVAFSVNGNTDRTFTSEFKLKMSDFGFTAPGIVEDEVLIKFAGKVN
jgi:polyisoprenoid-binding protein YceI